MSNYSFNAHFYKWYHMKFYWEFAVLNRWMIQIKCSPDSSFVLFATSLYDLQLIKVCVCCLLRYTHSIFTTLTSAMSSFNSIFLSWQHSSPGSLLLFISSTDHISSKHMKAQPNVSIKWFAFGSFCYALVSKAEWLLSACFSSYFSIS